MTAQKNTIPVFYTITDNYTPYVGVSIQSLINHSDPKKDYTITVMVQDITDEHKKQLENLATDNVHINIFHIDDKLLEPITNIKENYLRGQFFTLSIFYRLFIPELFPEYDKAVYLDADTIVNTDIADLYNLDIGDNMFASAPDLSIRFMPPLQKYISECQGILPTDKYINNGVILFDTKKFRDKKFVDRFIHLLTTYQVFTIDPDQSYMNEICEDQIYHLEKEWDAMPNENMAEFENPKIVHYNLFYKPWHYEDVQYAKYFWDVAKNTPFYSELKKQLDSYTDDDRQQDRADLDKMIEMFGEVKKADNNWANIKAKGEQVKL